MVTRARLGVSRKTLDIQMLLNSLTLNYYKDKDLTVTDAIIVKILGVHLITVWKVIS